ncbi:glycosyltransferase family 1 protein [Enterococcus sp. 669A]|uniref:Glycosyltransferase family 1 protein n=1 Tax=Candidatus Enterococcus moelleringii TaxID=2815325 RepID=A0ABS3LF16_9ENTE|nr:glycosyltransferase family 1 protein [Enterococcus sp. 669A]
MKRVLHFQGRMGLGGAESFMMNIYRKLDRKKVQFDFVIYDDYSDVTDYHEEIQSMGGRIFVVTNPKRNIIQYVIDVNKLLKKYEFDIVHNEVYFGGGLNLYLSKMNGIKKRIAHSHATEDGKGNGLLIQILRICFKKLLLKNGTDFLAVSHEAGVSLFGNNPFIIVHNGIDLKNYEGTRKDSIDKKNELGVPSDSFIIGNIGRLEKQKNQKLLIEIFSKIKLKKANSKLVIVGEGSLRSELEKQIIKNGLEKDILLLGERKDIPELLNIFDVFVMTSLYEGLPMVGLEAQASKKKLVLSDTISKDTMLTPNVSFVSLESPLEVWEEKITSPPFDNKITELLLTYDSDYTVKQIMEIYGI